MSGRPAQRALVPVLRPVRPADAARLWDLLESAGDELLGMTSLPSSADAAEEACVRSTSTLGDLAADTFELDDERQASLLFLLVNAGDDEPLGVTGITFKQAVPNLAVRVVTSRDGHGLDMASFSSPWTRTELNSSFMAPAARGRGFGTLLSRGRLMFLHQVHRQVPSTVASHVRGRFDDDGSAPFWQCFGHHFAPSWLTSREAERAVAEEPSRLGDLVGHRRPVTADVLDSLGPVNRASLPAFRVLMSEGLRPNGMYDPVDGGPTLVAEVTDTATGRARMRGRVRLLSTDATPDGRRRVFAAITSVDDFRVSIVSAALDEAETIGLSPEDAATLGVDTGALLAVAEITDTTDGDRASR